MIKPISRLAKARALRNFIGPEPVIGRPYSNARRKILIVMRKLFVSYWNNLLLGKLRIVLE